jgi:hypothetical protein
MLHVDHASGDYRYPIMVDPYVEEYFTNLTGSDTDLAPNTGRWKHLQTVANNGGNSNRIAFGTGNDGLLILGGFNNLYSPGDVGDWKIQAYPDTRIVVAGFNGVNYAWGGVACVDEFIMANVTNAVQGNGRNWCQTLSNHNADVCTDSVNPCDVGGATDQNWAVFRLRFLVGGQINGAVSATMKSSVIKYYEPYRPVITGLTPAPDQNRWYDPADLLYGFRIQAHDQGMGLQFLKWQGPNGLGGTYQQACSTGRDGRCPTDLPNASNPTSTFVYNGSQLNEGVNSFGAVAIDVIGNPSTGPYTAPTYDYRWVTNIDKTAPTVAAGTGAVRPGVILDTGQHSLIVTGNDVGAGGAQNSGIKKFRWWVDNVERTPNTTTCGSGACSTTFTLNTTTTGISEGLHTIKLMSEDGAGHSSQPQSFDVIVDRSNPTASATHTGLPTDWVSSFSAHTSVTGSDNQSGVKRAKITLPSPKPPLTRDYSACAGTVSDRCPTNPPPTTFDYTEADLADGDNKLTASTVDAANHESAQTPEWHIKLDRQGPTIDPLSGTLYANRDTGEGTELTPGSYTLHGRASEGSGTGATARSGVVRLAWYVDGEEQDSAPQPCGGGNCEQIVDFTYDTANYGGGLHTIHVVATDAVGNETESDTFNVRNGCCLVPATTWGTYSPSTYDIAFGDVDGDGGDDAIVRDKSLGTVKVGLATETGFGPLANWGAMPLVKDFSAADVDNDGMADILGRVSATNAVQVARSTGSAFGTPAPWGTLAAAYTKLLVADMDGDGRADLAGLSAAGDFVVGYARDNAFYAPESWGTFTAGANLLLADVDGDGAADLIGRAGNGDARVAISQAGSLAPVATWASPGGNTEFTVGDGDGDGAADLITRDFDTDGVALWASTDSSFSESAYWGSFNSAYSLGTADLDGDGNADLIGRQALSGAVRVALSRAPYPLGPLAEEYIPSPVDIELEPADTAPPGGVQAASSSPNMELAFQDDRRLLERAQLLGRQPGGTGSPDAAIDGNTNLYRDPWDPANTAEAERRINHIYERMADAGATIVRFNVQWGWTENRTDPTQQPSGYANNTRYYFDHLDDAVRLAHANGFKVELTLTGGQDNNPGSCPNYEHIGMYNPVARVCDTSSPSVAVDPSPADYGNFVTAVVNHYTRNADGTVLPAGHARRVNIFSFWNEPNNLSWLSTSHDHEIPAQLYHDIATQGWTAYRASINATPQVTGTKAFMGELASRRQSGYIPNDSYCPLSQTKKRCKPKPTEFLRMVANAAGGPITTDGLAYHPYQDHAPPWIMGKTAWQGVGRLREVGNELDSLCDWGTSTSNPTKHCRGRLVGPSGNRPGLYLTEFGYRNRPTGQLPKTVSPRPPIETASSRSYWHTEKQRKLWLEGGRAKTVGSGPPGTVPGALQRALDSRARWMLLYTATELQVSEEDPSGQPFPWRNKWDSGLIGRPGVDWTVAGDGGDINGLRPYGKKLNKKGFGFSQKRLAYCAVQRWALRRGFSRAHKNGCA